MRVKFLLLLCLSALSPLPALAETAQVMVAVDYQIGNEFVLLHHYNTTLQVDDEKKKEYMKAVAKGGKEQFKAERVNVLFYSGTVPEAAALVGSSSAIKQNEPVAFVIIPELYAQQPDIVRGLELAANYEISVVNLIKRFKENELAAEEDFKGKRISVSGRVDEVSKDLTGDPYVSLAADEYGFSGARCYPDKADPALRQIKSGSQLYVSGIPGLYMMGSVSLDECHIFPPAKK